ncbi:MAG TPA: BON domain-containing protein [Thermoanaerobaculia bacterium]|nr:BON domain-containing protein [Thermoanaerobaculia bacterium]
MDEREDRVGRGNERRQFDAYEGSGSEHGEPSEYRFGSGFDKPEAGRWTDQDREEIYSRPHDEWSSPGYVFYAGKGYHREFIDPYAGPVDPEAGEGGRGFQVARESSRGRFTGRGPKGYVRSDERILEDVNERLEEHGDLDPSDIAVSVSRGEITLEGSVTDRWSKRLAEDLAHSVSGVRDVQNRLGIAARAAEPDIDVDVQGPASHSGTGFLTRNIEVRPRRK